MPQILLAMLAFRSGDFTQRLPAQWTGVEGKIADAFNDILAISNRRAKEAARVCRVVGKEGRLQQRMSVPGVTGGWADEIQSINTLIADLASPTTAVTRTIGAVAKGDVKALSQISGVGKKTAERIVLELKDKVGAAGAWEAASAQRALSTEDQKVNDAVLALMALGFKQLEAHDTVRKVQGVLGTAATGEDRVRACLKKGS